MPKTAHASSPTARRAPRTAWHWGVVELLSAYLPLLMMALLALGTWWLVKNTPSPDSALTERPVRHEPDYEMRNFAVQRYTAAGPLSAQLEGDMLRHYPDTDMLEIDNVRLRAVGADGSVTIATARRGLATGDGSEVQLLGGAQIVREASTTSEAIDFRGEFLHAFLDTERVISHLPVTVTRGNTRVQAGAVEYRHADQVVQFSGRARATFLPRAPR